MSAAPEVSSDPTLWSDSTSAAAPAPSSDAAILKALLAASQVPAAAAAAPAPTSTMDAALMLTLAAERQGHATAERAAEREAVAAREAAALAQERMAREERAARESAERAAREAAERAAREAGERQAAAERLHGERMMHAFNTTALTTQALNLATQAMYVRMVIEYPEGDPLAGSRYEGPVTDGKDGKKIPNGAGGQMVYGKAIVALENPDGDTNAPPAPGGTYQGDWFHGERSGRGRFVFPDLSKFKTLTCDWQDNKPHGAGRLEYRDGTIYTGTFKAGLFDDRDGSLAVVCGDGSGELDYTFKGLFIKGLKAGKGTYEFEDGRRWSGDHVKDILVRADMTWPANCGSALAMYSGAVQNGVVTTSGPPESPSGWGVGTYFSGERYEGQWLEEKRHGLGILTRPDGQTFDGMWEGDLIVCGKHTFMPDGFYEGTFSGGVYDGVGKLESASRGKYIGGFKMGVYQGVGSLETTTFTKGRLRHEAYKGQFDKGRYHGRGRLVVHLAKRETPGDASGTSSTSSVPCICLLLFFPFIVAGSIISWRRNGERTKVKAGTFSFGKFSPTAGQRLCLHACGSSCSSVDLDPMPKMPVLVTCEARRNAMARQAATPGGSITVAVSNLPAIGSPSPGGYGSPSPGYGSPGYGPGGAMTPMASPGFGGQGQVVPNPIRKSITPSPLRKA